MGAQQLRRTSLDTVRECERGYRAGIKVFDLSFTVIAVFLVFFLHFSNCNKKGCWTLFLSCSILTHICRRRNPAPDAENRRTNLMQSAQQHNKQQLFCFLFFCSNQFNNYIKKQLTFAWGLVC